MEELNLEDIQFGFKRKTGTVEGIDNNLLVSLPQSKPKGAAKFQVGNDIVNALELAPQDDITLFPHPESGFYLIPAKGLDIPSNTCYRLTNSFTFSSKPIREKLLEIYEAESTDELTFQVVEEKTMSLSGKEVKAVVLDIAKEEPEYTITKEEETVKVDEALEESTVTNEHVEEAQSDNWE